MKKDNLSKNKEIGRTIDPDKLYRNYLIISIINIGIFSLLCLAVFIIIILPIIQWLYFLREKPLADYFLKLWFVGIPTLAVTALYGSVLFWPLLMKYNHIRYNNHDIDIYIGVKKIIVCVDKKIVSYATRGFYSSPEFTWYIQIGDEYTTIEVIKKNQYRIYLNSEPINFHKIELESKTAKRK